MMKTLCKYFICGQLPHYTSVNGITIAKTHKGCFLKLWLKNSQDTRVVRGMTTWIEDYLAEWVGKSEFAVHKHLRGTLRMMSQRL